MAASSTSQWTLLLVLTALLLSLLVLAQVATSYATAYFAAPREIASFVDAADSSVEEKESYDRDVARVPRLEDKIRLGRLLREIQKGGDDLREDLNGLLLGEDDQRLKTLARLLWAAKRRDLEEKMRRLDLLRTRFLVVYLGIVAAGVTEKAEKAEKEKKSTPTRDPEKMRFGHESAKMMPQGLAEGIKRKPPLRRLTTQAIGHHDSVGGNHRQGWAGVVRELQLSPLM